MKRHLALWAAALSLVIYTSAAAAESHTCTHVEDDQFSIDGMLDDWKGFRGKRPAGGNVDRDFVLRCAYDAEHLYMSINIRDDRVFRTRRARANFEDSITVHLSAGKKVVKLRYFPGSGRTKPNRKGVPKSVEVEDSLQPKGLSFEAAFELSKIPGWAPSVPMLNATVAYHDSDGKRIDTIKFAGPLHFSAAASTYRSFLRASRLRKKNIRLDVLADVDPGKGVERVIVGGTLIAILSESYTWMNLPVASVRDILDVKVVDLSGDGRSSIIAHYRQSGNGGVREIVSVWQVKGNGEFETILAFEVAKSMGGNKLRSSWKLVPKPVKRKRGKRKRRTKGFTIHIEAGAAVGWDEDNYFERPAPDAKPILLPWSDNTTAVWSFDGGIATLAE